MKKDGFGAIRQQVKAVGRLQRSEYLKMPRHQVIPDKKKVARKNACRGRVNY